MLVASSIFGVNLHLFFFALTTFAFRASWSLASWVYALDTQGLFMTSAAAKQAAHDGRMFLLCFGWLAHDAFCAGDRLYKLRPKLHVFHHWAQGSYSLEAVPMNPKAYSCWEDEDFVRRVCAIALGCGHRGIISSLLCRYLASVTELWLGIEETEGPFHDMSIRSTSILRLRSLQAEQLSGCKGFRLESLQASKYSNL